MKSKNLYIGDFETTVFEGQQRTDVWAAAMTRLFDETDYVDVFHSIDEMWDAIARLDKSIVLYFHNLKFDGNFWLNFILKKLQFKPALDQPNPDDPSSLNWLSNFKMPDSTYKCAISAMGQWYSITIKFNKRVIEIRDSLKLLPFSVKRIGESFKTRHKKLEMEYKGFRYPGCEITPEEMRYIANDVLVVREAMEFALTEGHDKLTIGACCLDEFKKTWGVGTQQGDEIYARLFPNLYEIPIDDPSMGAPNADAWVRRSYHGGWCYLVPGKATRRLVNGCTADVNSLYPSMMSKESGNTYPVGKPLFITKSNLTALLDYSEKYPGSKFMRCITAFNKQLELPSLSPKSILHFIKEVRKAKLFVFLRFKTRFYIRGGKLPFIQIKSSFRYRPTECLTTTDVWDKASGKFVTHTWEPTGEEGEMTLKSTRVELTMTMMDFELFIEHYRTVQFELLDMMIFKSDEYPDEWNWDFANDCLIEGGLFDNYINHYRKLKETSTGAMREFAKLFLNNLYGKMASSTNSDFKIPYIKEDGSLGFKQHDANDKKPGYIPVGSCITSYARCFTIRAAQKNYHGPDKPGFVYADTDSIHCDLPPEKVVGITVHPTAFCCWKLECNWDVAWFTRQKTYIEHVTHKDLKQVSKPYYDIKCAGMPERPKELFAKSLDRWKPDTGNEADMKYWNSLPEDQQGAILAEYNLSDFKVGLILPGKLRQESVPGGALLVDSVYEMRPAY